MTQRDVIARLTEVSIGFPKTDHTYHTVVQSISLAIRAGERIGLIGASGSGKSLTALSFLGLVPPPGVIVGGSVEIRGEDIRSESAAKTMRGGTIGMVFQEAEAALNPVLTVGAHLEETIKRHRPSEEMRWRRIAVDLLEKVDLEPLRILKSHPHRLSGGQRQRALLAIALAGEPDLLIADEPTSSLDVLTQARMLGLIDTICSDRGLALVLISHDLGVVASLVERIVVLLAGAIIEDAPIKEFLDNPLHPYSQTLVASSRSENTGIGQPTGFRSQSGGCAFVSLCPRRTLECDRDVPDLVPIGSGRSLRCPIVASEVDQ